MKKFSIILGLVFTLFTTLCFNLKAEELANTNNTTNNNNWYNNFYVGAGAGALGDINFEKNYSNGIKENAIPVKNNINLSLGYNLSKYIAFETEYSYFMKNEYFMSNNKVIYYSGYSLLTSLVLKHTISRFTPFVALGVKYVQFHEVLPSRAEDYIDIAPTVGIGVDYNIYNQHSIGVKYSYNNMPSINEKEIDEENKNKYKSNFQSVDLTYKYSFK